LKIIYKQISELIPYINNPRKNDHAVDAVASSIKNFGWQQPIVIDKQNEVIAGHTRLKAAQKLNLKEVPCYVAENLTDSQIKAYRITDNRVNEESNWDFDLLKIELQGIDEFTGFSKQDMKMFESLKYEEIPEKIFDEVDQPEEKKIKCPNCGHEDKKSKFK
jgi:site-specific DNA-methyltransferase (adenine-specific)